MICSATRRCVKLQSFLRFRANVRASEPAPASRAVRSDSGQIRSLAPLLGADNTAILRDFGYTDDEVARLVRSRPKSKATRKSS